MNGTWLLPSLNRPHLLKEFFQSYKETEGSTPGMVLVDRNDPSKEEYLKLDYPKGWKLVLTDAVSMGDKVRSVWDDIRTLEWVGILNDDHRPRTPLWDQKIVNALNGTNVICTNDGPTQDKPWNAPSRLCGAICFSGKILQTLGYMFPPGVQHFYSDDAWGVLFGKAACAQFLMDVCVEHDHAYKDPSKRDDTYYKVNGNADFQGSEPHGGFWDTDREAFQKWFKEQGEADAQKIMALQPKTGIMVATPSHDGSCSMAYALGLTDTAMHMSAVNVYFEMARVVGSSLITHARNSLVDMFLKSRCQKLLFVDADQGWNREAAAILYSSNRRIISGITPHKRFPINLNFKPLEEDMHYFKDVANKTGEEFKAYVKVRADLKGEIEVDRSGTGFMMIDRSVFEIMSEHVDSYSPYDDREGVVHKEFFTMGSDGKRFRGEDWKFCALAQKLSIPIYINSHVIIPHDGTYTYQIDESYVK